jgi:hypothetical protein
LSRWAPTCAGSRTTPTSTEDTYGPSPAAVVSNRSGRPSRPEVPLRAIPLISTLRTSSYCLVTPDATRIRASISSTCHPILPGCAAPESAHARQRRCPAPQRRLAPARLSSGTPRPTPACRQAADAEER